MLVLPQSHVISIFRDVRHDSPVHHRSSFVQFEETPRALANCRVRVNIKRPAFRLHLLPSFLDIVVRIGRTLIAFAVREVAGHVNRLRLGPRPLLRGRTLSLRTELQGVLVFLLAHGSLVDLIVGKLLVPLALDRAP